jgi:protein tyrosine phosphatase (PTP) superfamily phosphohydrolase (DUF442 family)
MNERRSWFYCALPLGTLGLAGCQHCGGQSCYQPAPPSPVMVRSAAVLPAHPLAPCAVCPAYPTPPPHAAAPAVALNPPAPVNPPAAAGGYQPLPSGPVQQAWGPASPPTANLGGPVPVNPERPRESARLGAPESAEPPKAVPPGPERAPTPRLPVGIANFAEVMPGVASGLRPMLDGLDWLRANGYKTALQIREPAENGDGDRHLLQQRGLTYLSLEVSPKTLTPAVVDEFNRIVADPANRPLFVYDKDGSLAGALWYLHFRTADKLSDEEARKKAAALGLKEDGEGPQRELWLAIQKYLAEREKN